MRQSSAPGGSRPRPLRKALRAFLLLAIAATFTVAAPAAWAQGKARDPILEADNLIRAKNFDGAILFLTDFIKKNPDRFDEAQARLRQVIAAREAYNKAAEELLKVLRDPAKNKDEKLKLQLINKLRDIGGTPNAETLTFISTVESASLFVVNQDEFRQIFVEGRSLIDQGKYAEAAAAYTKGFKLYRQQFDEGPYDDITKKSVASMVDKINAETAYFAASQSALTTAVQAFAKALAAGNAAEADAAWPAAKEAMEDRARRRDIVVRTGRAMSQQFEVIKRQDKTVVDASFLPFAFRFTLGNVNATQPEGVAGAMDSQWARLMTDIETAFTKKLEETYANAEAAYDQGNWTRAAQAFRDVDALSKSGLPALALWSLLAPTETLPALSTAGRNLVQAKPLVYERARQLAVSAESEAILADLVRAESANFESSKSIAAAFTKDSDLQASLASLAEDRKAAVSAWDAIAVEAAKAGALEAELARWKGQGLEATDSGRAMAAWRARLDAATAQARKDEIAIVDFALGFEYSRLEAEFLSRAADFQQAKTLLDGTPPAGAAGTLVFIARYPSRSMTSLNALAQPLANFKARTQGYLARLAAEKAWVTADEGARSWAAKARDLVAKADALEAERTSTLARAREQKRQADSAKTEADLRMQQARTALGADDFDTARDRLAKAGDRYLASLGFEESAELRATSDAAQAKLGADIIKAENDKVIRDTRVLITGAKSAYFQGNFTKAEDSLLQARARWATTHGQDAEPEVEYWLRLAQAALSVNTGRTIAPTAPLYAEMSQLLSLARSDYEKGKNLLDQKKRTDATAAFDSARARINQVKVVFPLNQEAGILALRIDQIQDPAAFKQQFAQKFAEAKAGLKSVTNTIYANLQDLARIDPNYPGLKDAIYQAEIGLGLRLPPPDPARQRRANDLIAAARAIVDSGNTGQFSIALQQINDAIQLDPNNDKALAIKDRILTFQGGSAQIVLSSASEELYRQAVQEFQAGNFLQANAIVTRLLQDPKNANSQKILDLSKKIKARL